MPVIHSYAQTNLQLYNQMLKAGYSEEELIGINNAYKLAIELFTAVYRPNGKPFISHLVGTASILAAQQAPATVVSAGLLHATYTHGLFPDPGNGITHAKRQRVRLSVSSEVEELVAKYTLLPWEIGKIRDLRDRVTSLDTQERQVVLMRLANEVEDHLDLGILYGSKDKSAKLDFKVLVELAKEIGSVALANELAQVLSESASAKIPDVLRRTEKQSFIAISIPLGWKIKRLMFKVVNSTLRFPKVVMRAFS